MNYKKRRYSVLDDACLILRLENKVKEKVYLPAFLEIEVARRVQVGWKGALR